LWFWLTLLFAIIPAVSGVLVSAGFLVYIYWPLDLSQSKLPVVTPKTTKLVVVSHGLNDSATGWAGRMKQLLEQRSDGVEIFALDWNPYSRHTLRCSVDGKRIGHRLGKHLANAQDLRTVHLIGHSCGAFVNLGACEALKAARPDVAIHTTYLDAVAIYGGIRWEYGIDHFGTCADFSDAYIDTGDKVPGSDRLIPATHTIDVTAARQASTYTGSPHMWPIEYYNLLQHANKAPALSSDLNPWSSFPRGVLSQGELPTAD
jgi:hypothetical protein